MAALGLRCCMQAFSSCGEGGYSSLRCAGFSLRWFLLLRSMGSRRAGFSSCGTWAQYLWLTGSVVVAHGLSSCGSRALERRLTSCGARTYLLRSMWDLPGPGLEPVSPALAGGFLTTEPPGKSHVFVLIDIQVFTPHKMLPFVKCGHPFSSEGGCTSRLSKSVQTFS